MKLSIAVLSALGALYLSAPAFAEGSAEAGQAKSATCVACHGVDGNSVNPEWPSLAGQHHDYIVKQLADFKARRRTNDAGNMTAVSRTLSDEDIEDLAHYLTGL